MRQILSRKIQAILLMLCGLFLTTPIYAAPITYYFAGTMNDDTINNNQNGKAFGTIAIGTPYYGSFTYEGSQVLNTPSTSYVGQYTYTNASLTLGGVTLTDTANPSIKGIRVYNNPYPTDLLSLDSNGSIGLISTLGGLNLSTGWLSIVLQDLSRTAFSSPEIPRDNLTISNFSTGNPTFIQLKGTSPSQINEITGQAYSYSRGDILYLGTSAPTAPSVPVITEVSAGSTTARVSFTAQPLQSAPPTTGYTIISTPGNILATGTASPITVTGLTNGVSYTFKAVATNLMGNSDLSVASSSVTPTQVLKSLSIIGSTAVNELSSATYSLLATYDIGTTATVTGILSIATTSYATLSGSSLNVGDIAGNKSVSLNATYTENGVTRTATLPVTLINTANILTGLSIVGTCSSCGTTTVNESSTSTYGVIASYDNGSTASVTATVTLDATTNASLNGSTLKTNNVFSDQPVTLRATYIENGVTKTATYPITVKNSVNYLTSIAINGATSLASGGANSAYTVTATYDNGSTSTVAASLTASGNGAILISGQLLTGSITVNSTVTLSATYTENGITKTATLPVTIVAPVVATTTTTTTTTSTSTSTSTTVATTTTTTVLNKTINLVQGWNLIGSGGTSSYSVSSLFSDKSLYTSVWKWIASSSQWAFYTPTMTATDLQSFASGQGYSALDNVSGSDGIWVNAKSDTSITIPFGTAYTATNQRGNLIKNWNLISIGESLTPVRFNNYLTQYTGSAPPAIASSSTSSVFQVNLISLWAWNAPLSSWYFYSPTLDQSGTLASFIGTQGYLDFNSNNQKLQSGMGFCVNMP